jgi:hypothetical protein
LVTTVTGTFLPWLRSGTVTRTSYEVLALRGFAGLDDLTGEFVRAAWVAVTPVALLCAVLFAVRFRRFGAYLAIIFGTITGTVAALAAVQGGNEGSLVGISRTGPVVTLGGAALVIAGAITVLITRARKHVSTSGGTP